MYAVRFTKSAERQFEALPAELRQRVVQRLLVISEQPRGRGVVKLRGSRSPVIYRVRIGRDYRLTYTVQDAEQLVLVTWVGHRRDAYRDR